MVEVKVKLNLQGINEFNVEYFYMKDKLHMNEAGYRRLGPVQGGRGLRPPGPRRHL